MASPTKQTRTQRRNKKTKAGQKRKKELRNKGTTLSSKELFQDQEQDKD